MLKSIEYLPQFKAEKRSFLDQEAVISITDPDVSDANLNSTKYLLRLKFLDIEKAINHPNFKAESLFNSTQALQIKNFVDTLPDTVTHLIVHCFVGASRSAAVALALEAYTGGELFKRDESFDANVHVLNLCSQAFGLTTPVEIPPVDTSKLSNTLFTF